MDAELREMAEKAGLEVGSGLIHEPDWKADHKELAAFAAMVAERCALVADKVDSEGGAWAASFIRQLAAQWREAANGK